MCGDVRSIPFASFWCDAEFGRYRGIAAYRPPRKEPNGQQAQQRLHDLVQADKLRRRPQVTLARLRNQRDRD